LRENNMKKIIYVSIFILILSMIQYGVDFGAGIFTGLRTVNDSEIKDVYGSGMDFFIYLDAKVWKGLTLGVGYGLGYSQNGKIGIFEEDSNLKMNGLELFLAYQFELKKFSPYLKLGYAFVHYKQEIESEFATEEVNDTKGALTISGGTKVFLSKKLYLAFEIKFTSLKVTPVDVEVNLGGVGYYIGLGILF
jgi:opacity protein-like surface antigen